MSGPQPAGANSLVPPIQDPSPSIQMLDQALKMFRAVHRVEETLTPATQSRLLFHPPPPPPQRRNINCCDSLDTRNDWTKL